MGSSFPLSKDITVSLLNCPTSVDLLSIHQKNHVEKNCRSWLMPGYRPLSAVDQLQKRDGAPEPAYGAPAPEYGAPASTYEQPADSYGVSYGGYEEETLPDLTPIIVGILVLTGLSLLFPTFVSLTTVRRKRHAEDDVNPMSDV